MEHTFWNQATFKKLVVYRLTFYLLLLFLQKERLDTFFFSREYNSLFGYYYICNNDNSFFACVHHHGQIWWRGKKWWNTGCLFCFFLFLFCLFLFSFFSCQKVPIGFSNFHNFFLTAITIAVIKTFVFLFSTLWFLLVCFCVVTQNFETGDESRSAEQKSFFLSAAGIIKSTDGRGLETYMVAPPTFFSK